MTITDVAEHLNVSRKTLSKVLNGRGAITPEMAFAQPSADHWLACTVLMVYQCSEVKRLSCKSNFMN
ncbi:helix-turn-helix domain-containing protein [Vibrio mimicus]